MHADLQKVDMVCSFLCRKDFYFQLGTYIPVITLLLLSCHWEHAIKVNNRLVASLPLMSDSNIVHVGSPHRSIHFVEWTSTKVIIHGFAKIPRNDSVVSPEFKCLDHQWCLAIPTLRGSDITMHLVSASNKKIGVEYMFTVKNQNDEQVYKSESRYHCFNSLNPMDWKSQNKMCYDKALDYVREFGALVIEVHMKKTEEIIPPFTPENPLMKMIQDKFLDEESSDILFEVGAAKEIGTIKIVVVRNLFLEGSPATRTTNQSAGKQLMNSPLSWATMSTSSSHTFPAHRFILQLCSTTLAELCESVTDKMSPIQISGVSPWAFYTLLYYIYGGKITDIHDDEDLEANARDLIDAADRFGVINLKLEVEARYVDSTTITTDNVVELLLYADSKNCALLKEAAMDFIAENVQEVLDKASLKDVPGGLYSDLLAAVAREREWFFDDDSSTQSSIDRLSTMPVSDLRRQAHKKGLDYDGSREVLIDALKSIFEKNIVSGMMDD